MINKIIARTLSIFIAVLICASATPVVFAQIERRSAGDIGGEIYYYNYEEPNFAELEGVYYGVNGSYTNRAFHPNLALRGEVRAAWGVVDYASNGTGSLDSIDDFVVEPRGWLGYDIPMQGAWLTPYVGIGYRYLENGMGGTTTSTGARGYDRISQYLYIPVGLEIAGELNQDWTMTVAVEYDIFCDGEQESQLSDVSLAFGDITNDQNDGDGFRASLRLAKKMPTYTLVIEPFIRYWIVSDSVASPVTFAGVAVGYGLEPENETYEIGAKVALQF